MPRPVTLFTGQFADLPFTDICRLAAEWGYDGLEIACWGDHFDVQRAVTEDGYVERRRDTSDRRRHIVEITRTGKRALERAERALESVEDDVLAALSTQERTTLRQLLVKAMEGVTGSVHEPAVASAERRRA